MVQGWLKLPGGQLELAVGLAGIARVLAGDKGTMIGQDGQ